MRQATRYRDSDLITPVGPRHHRAGPGVEVGGVSSAFPEGVASGLRSETEGDQALSLCRGPEVSLQVTPHLRPALTGAGVGKWLRAFGAIAAFSGLACRKPSLSRLLSSLLPGRVRLEELDGTCVC